MPRFAPWLCALALAALVGAKFDVRTGFTSLIRFSSDRETTRLPALQAVPVATLTNSTGYDGQFYAQLAIDPTLRDPALRQALDAPAYRARRIAAPFAAWLIGFGQPGLILQVYALLNVTCWAALAWLLYRETSSTPHAFARWAACLFSMGVLESVRQSLVDLPALLLLVLALRAQRAAQRPSAPLLALGYLTKETNLLGGLALALGRPLSARHLALFAASAVPLGLWLAYVAYRFPGGETGAGNFSWPLVGAWHQLVLSTREVTAGNFESRHVFGVLGVLSLCLQCGFVALHRDPYNPWWRVGAAYAVLFLFLGTWVWSGYWAACRAVLPLTIAFNLLLPAGRAFWLLWALGNITALHAIWRFL